MGSEKSDKLVSFSSKSVDKKCCDQVKAEFDKWSGSAPGPQKPMCVIEKEKEDRDCCSWKCCEKESYHVLSDNNSGSAAGSGLGKMSPGAMSVFIIMAAVGLGSSVYLVAGRRAARARNLPPSMELP